jgi:glycosyltransferase involved in cell wall biosynthesis
MPLVRIVIPTFNRSRLLVEAVLSTVTQPFVDFEVIIADDGSTDDTRAVAQTLIQQDARVRYMFHGNRGLAGTRNAAIEASGSFRYLALLDSDDIWSPWHLERMVDILEQEPEVALMFARIHTVDSTGTWTAEARKVREDRMERALRLVDRPISGGGLLLQSDGLLRSILRSELCPHPSTVVVRKDAVGFRPWFNEALVVFEDLDFYLNLARRCLRFAFVDEIHATVRYQGDNLTTWIDFGSAKQLQRLESVVAHFESRLELCQHREDRNVVCAEIASSAYLGAQCMAEQYLLRQARNFYLKSIAQRYSARAVKGYIYTYLPLKMFTGLKRLKKRLRLNASGAASRKL